MTDAEWLILSQLLPAPSRCGRHRKREMWEVVHAIFCALRGGIARSLLPKDFAPWPTVYRWFTRFRDGGTWETINHHLAMRATASGRRDATLRWLSVIRFADAGDPGS